MSLKPPITNERISRIRSLRLVIINFSIGCLVALLCFSAREAHGQTNPITELIEKLELSRKLTSPESNQKVRLAATDVLGRVGAEAIETIRRLTAETTANNKDDGARRDALRYLGQLREKVGDAVSALIKALNDNTNDQYVRQGAAYALGEMKMEAMEAVPKLIRALEEDTSPHVRSAAATALGKIRADASEVVPALTEKLEDEDPNVRRDVLIALGTYREEAREAQWCPT